jgi:hypothetical protein
MLADFGQVAPTTYTYTQPPQQQVWQGYGDYSSATQHPATNNIFWNETLFQAYFKYMNDTLIPIFKSHYHITPPLPENLTLDTGARIQPVPVVFIRNYSCVQRQRKPLLSCVVSILVAAAALFGTSYRIVIGTAGWIQGRSDSYTGSLRFVLTLMVANCCIGHLDLEANQRDPRPQDILETGNGETHEDPGDGEATAPNGERD